jgi:tetratricopeptide (TPR) repeat protein
MDPVDACLRRAQASLQQRAFAAALGWFDHAAALRPGLVLAHVGRAVSLLELDREFDAEDALADAYDASGAPGETDLVLARLYALGGERGAALRQLGAALQAAPDLTDLARADPAFRGMRDHPQFLMTLGDL